MVTRRPVLAAAALTGLLTGLLTALVAGCGADDTEPAGREAGAPIAVAGGADEMASVGEIRQAIASGATVIDVRTRAEFAAGHLRGARHLDLQSPDFADRVARLDPSRAYVVYCASGNRAGQARELMLEQGIDEVLNAGGYADLDALGFPTREPRG